jgi:MinD superfamily P-loop ATPase
MQIALASGKGGTGKTTLATNLARVAAGNGHRVAYLDVDVEEPNGHIFLKPKIDFERAVNKQIPHVNTVQCTQCGECGAICQFTAILCVNGPPMVFPDLCHACGGCTLICPTHAVEEVSVPIGKLRIGTSGAIRFADGTLEIGQHMGPPVIRAAKESAPPADLLFVDAPPGTSCPVVEAVRGSDLVLLVTEPTPFGLNDLKLASEMIHTMQLPAAVVINRANEAGSAVREFCLHRRIPLAGELPDERAVAEAYSRGQLPCDVVPGYRERIDGLLRTILSILVSR